MGSSENPRRVVQPVFSLWKRRLRTVDWQRVPHSEDVEVKRTYHDGGYDTAVQSHTEFADSVFKGMKFLKKLCDEEKKHLLLAACGLTMTASLHAACCPGCPLCLHLLGL